MPRASGAPTLTAGLLMAAGAMLVLLALGYNEVLLGPFIAPQAEGTRVAIRWVQLTLLLVGALAIVLGVGLRRPGPLASLASRPIVPKLMLACMVTVVPLLAFEVMLRPFVDTAGDAPGRRTTIFERDEALGWKLRPGARDVWGDVPVEINAKGLRGPELDYDKPEDVRRILYLGDSVTFGFKLPSHEQTYPYLIEPILERGLNREVETINAGVGGYSPWQERVFLEAEGIRYDPDLVILGFVLNDVVEKFELARFGGNGRGYQLAHTARSRVEELVSSTAIGQFGMRLQARLRYGGNVPEGAAAMETVGVQTLAHDPEGDKVRLAWEITLESLDEIVAFCESKKLPLIIVAFPHVFQFQDAEGLAAPQRRLRRYAAERRVPVVDLLPVFEARLQTHLDETPSTYFLDHVHLTEAGGRIAAEAIAGALVRSGWN